MFLWLLVWFVGLIFTGSCVRSIFFYKSLTIPDIPIQDLWYSMFIGIYQDLLAAILLLVPLACTLLIKRNLFRITLVLTISIVCLVTIAEVFFWNEFGGRLDRLVFHYLRHPIEVLVFLEDQFLLSIFMLPFFAVVYLIYKFYIRFFPSIHTRQEKLFAVIIIGLSTCIVIWHVPVRHSDFRPANELAENGYLSVLRAARVDETQWNKNYDDLSNQLKLYTEKKSGPKLDVKHVILIIEESFAGSIWNQKELRKKYLPQMSALAEEGVLFDNIYATGSRTTRGLEAILNGYPPLPGIAVNQRSGFQKLPSLARVLHQSEFLPIFIYGGWPNFSNFQEYWKESGFVEQRNRNDFEEETFQTSWGVADEYLFSKILTEMDTLTAVHEHIFLTKLTVSFHRPYDFPPNRIQFPSNERKAEYAMAYADWALGEFYEKAKKTEWFNDTLFVIAADHAPRIGGSADIPMDYYRVPLLFLAPNKLPPKIVSHAGSLMSVPKTILGLLDIIDTENFYGSNLFVSDDNFVPVEHDYHVGLFENDRLTILLYGGGISEWIYQDERLLPTVPDLNRAALVSTFFSSAHKRFYSEQSPTQ